MLVVTAVLTDAANGFAAGIVAASPHATGTYHWGGLSLLQGGVTVQAVGGQTTVSGGGLSPASEPRHHIRSAGRRGEKMVAQPDAL